jgi:hypothetical protein
MAEEELTPTEKIIGIIDRIKKIEMEIDESKFEIRVISLNGKSSSDNKNDIDEILARIKVKESNMHLLTVQKYREMSLRDKTCFQCLMEEVTRSATTRISDGLPICISHYNQAQRDKVKDNSNSSKVYEAPGNLEERLR